LVLVILGITWVPFISYISDEVWIYLQSIQAYFSPAICVIFILGIFWKRATAKAAISVLIVGTALGVAKFVAQIFIKHYEISSQFIVDIINLNFLYYSLIQFVICLIAMVVISLSTTAPEPSKLLVLNISQETIEVNTSTTFSKKSLVISSSILLLLLLLVILMFI
jgi:SSS family solute:Na+ symporter